MELRPDFEREASKSTEEEAVVAAATNLKNLLRTVRDRTSHRSPSSESDGDRDHSSLTYKLRRVLRAPKRDAFPSEPAEESAADYTEESEV